MTGKPDSLDDTDDRRSMLVLEAIEGNPNVSQRELARSVGVALGVANSLVHALVRKGLVKVRGANNRSITYHLTKRGAAHKAALAMRWTMQTVDFYRQARQSVLAGLRAIRADGHERIALVGANEVAEIALLVAAQADVTIVTIVRHDESYAIDHLLGVPLGDASALARSSAQAVVLCLDPSRPEYAEMLDLSRETAPDLPIYTPSGMRL